MLPQDIKLQMFSTIMDFSEDEATLMAQAATRMVRNMEFDRTANPALNNDARFLYDLEGAKLALTIARQRASDVGKPAAEKERNMRGLCAMLEIEYYQEMPSARALSALDDLIRGL